MEAYSRSSDVQFALQDDFVTQGTGVCLKQGLAFLQRYFFLQEIEVLLLLGIHLAGLFDFLFLEGAPLDIAILQVDFLLNLSLHNLYLICIGWLPHSLKLICIEFFRSHQ